MKIFTMLPRLLFVSITAITLVTIAPSIARADEVYIAGFTTGCFGVNCNPTGVSVFAGLTYTNSAFSGTTANGFRALGGNPVPGTNFNNLGAITLSTLPAVYNAVPFTLQITFTAPQGINGSNQATYMATLFGTVSSDNQGGVLISFPSTVNTFSFNDTNCEPDPTGGIPGQITTCGVGSFSFSVNSLSIDPAQIASVTGQVFAAQQTSVPEPATLLLFGTGLSGLAGAARRRLKNRQVKS